jgi:hypothetical protein
VAVARRERKMLKTLKNIGFFQKTKDSQKNPNPGENVSNNLQPKQKAMQPHSNDMCCGSCGGGRKEK